MIRRVVCTTASSVTRFDDLKKELQSQINATIDEKMQGAQHTIEQVQKKMAENDSKLEAFERNTVAQFNTIKMDQQALANTLQTTSEGILGRMQSMFQQFQQETEKGFTMLQQQLEAKVDNDDSKRPKLS